MNEEEYYNALRKIMQSYCCIIPHRSGKRYFMEQCDIAIKINNVKYPNFNSYSGLLEFERESHLWKSQIEPFSSTYLNSTR